MEAILNITDPENKLFARHAAYDYECWGMIQFELSYKPSVFPRMGRVTVKKTQKT